MNRLLRTPAWLALGASLLLSVVAYVAMDRVETSDLLGQFDRLVDQDAEQVEATLRDCEFAAIVARQLFVASRAVGIDEFEGFAKGLPRFPGVQALSWNPYVTAGERAAFETELRGDYGATASIRDRAGAVLIPAVADDEYCAVRFIWPRKGNEAAVGYNVGAEPIRAAAAERARDTGLVTITAPIRIVQETEESHANLVFAPFYTSGASVATVEDRRKHCEGFVVAAIRTNPIIQDTVARNHHGPQGLDLTLYDTQVPGAAGVMYVHESRASTSSWTLSRIPVGTRRRVEFEIGGRSLELSAAPTEHFASLHSSGRLGTLVVGLLLVNVCVGLSLVLAARQRKRIDAQARVVLETELKLRHQADRANAAKSEFLAVMSHELRTPMNGVIGLLEVLMQTSLKPSQMMIAKRIRSSASALVATLSEILDFSKIEANKLVIVNQPMILEEVILAPCTMLDSLARSKRVGCTVFVDPAFPHTLLGDSARIQQILVNLLSNAIKFSSRPNRQGNVSVRAVMAGADKLTGSVWLELSVRDDGVGMSPEARTRLFQPFEQESASTSQRFGGTGLGLSISQQLARLMAGEIRIDSTPGEGTVVTLRIPLGHHAGGGSGSREQPLAGLECCVVGHDTVLAHDVAAYLTHAGAKVRFSAALAELPSQEPSCWVLDAEQSRSLSQVRDAICVFIGHDAGAATTSLSKYFVLMRGIRRKARFLAPNILGLDADMATREAIVHSVALLTGRAHGAAEETADARNLQNEAVLAGSFDANLMPRIDTVKREDELKAGRLILVAEDNETNQEVMRLQLAMLGYAVDIAENGQVALELWRSTNYALVLADIQMPLLDGYGLMLGIRADEATSTRARTPIIAVTANALASTAEHCLELGASECLSKPLILDDLKAALARWVPAHAQGATDGASPAREATAVPASEDPPATAGTSGPPVDLVLLEEVLGNSSPALLTRVARNFQVVNEPLVAQLEAAVLAGRLADVRKIAHRLSGSSATLAAGRLSELCAKLEHTKATECSPEMQSTAREIKSEFGRVVAYFEAQFGPPGG